MFVLHKTLFKEQENLQGHWKKLVIDVLDFFPVQLSYGVITSGLANLFVHFSVCDRQKFHGENVNFGILYYVVVSSLFILWKFYLYILARIVLNHCDKYIIPALLSGLGTDDCRKSTVCTPTSCSGLKKYKIKEFVYISGIKMSKKLAEKSCRTLDSYYVIEVFNTYQYGIDYNKKYLSIEWRNKKKWIIFENVLLIL